MASPETAGASADGMMARSRISYGSDAEAPTDHSRWPRRDRDRSIMLDESDTEVGRMAEDIAKDDGPAHQRKQDLGECNGAGPPSAAWVDFSSRSLIKRLVQRVAGGGPVPTGGK